MNEEEILALPARVLSQAQRESYFENGYILLEGLIGDDWLSRLRVAMDETITRSGSMTESDDEIWLEKGHSADNPRLLRLNCPDVHHPDFWAYATQSVLPDIAADLIGPDVRFSHSLLNFKWANVGQEVKWHQDIQFYPHTNYSPLSFGTLLEDVGLEQGPIRAIPGSHKHEVFPHYTDDGTWTACIQDRNLEELRVDEAPVLMGPAGSVTVHNCRTVHGSDPNRSDRGRPFLVNTYTAADALPYTTLPQHSAKTGSIVRGKAATYARLDPRPCPLPPDWSGGFSIRNAATGEIRGDAG
jgi:ectoine hydroxylase